MKKTSFLLIFALLVTGIVTSVAVSANKLSPPRYGAIQMPAWSPDGAKVAFVYTVAGNADVYMVDANGKKLINVSRNDAVDINPVWSPDSQTLLFSSNRKNHFDIYSINRNEGKKPKPKRLTNSKADDLWPAWHPDGNTIAYCNYEKGFPRVYFMKPDGSSPEPFYEERSCFPDFSSDGKRIALSSNGDLLVFKLENKKSKNITEDLIWENMVDDTMPVWAPKGNRIAFMGRYEAYSSEVYTISASGKKVRRITDNMFEDFKPQWQPNGKGVIYSAFVEGRPPEIFISQPESPEKERITNNHSVEMSPVFSPDGQKILYVKRGDTQDQLYIMDKDGSNQELFLKDKLPTISDIRKQKEADRKTVNK